MGDNNIPAPPPGFQPVSNPSIPPPPPGFQPVDNAPPPPSGFAPVGDSSAQPSQTPAPTQEGLMDKILSIGKEGVNEVGDVAEGTKKFLDNIVGYKASDAAKDHMAKGYSAIKDGNVSEAQFHLRSAAEDIVENHPLSELLKAQWDSSMRNLEATKEAMKKKDHLSTVQHAAGIMPVASIVSDAMDKAVAEPTLHNIMHAVVTGGLALLPGAMKGMSKAGEVGTETAPLANSAEDSAATEPPTTGTNTGVTHAYDPSTGEIKPVSKAEQVAQKSVAKAGLDKGEAATPAQTVTTPSKTIKTVETEPTSPPSGTMHEAILQHQIRTQINRVAQENGLEQIPQDVDIRNAAQDLSDQFYNRSKAGFKQVKDATGVDLNFIHDQIKDLQYRKALTFADPDKEGAIIEKINALNDEAVKAMQDAEAKGIDTKQPLSDWGKSKMASDYQQDLRASTDPHQKIGTLDPGKYVKRVEKRTLSDPRFPNADPRLNQLFGDEGAGAMRDDAYAADQVNQAIKTFKPEKGTTTTTKIAGTKTVIPATPATESQALYDLVRKNTGMRWESLGLTRTNWYQTLKDFDALPEATLKAEFRDPAAVRKFLAWERTKQLSLAAARGIAVQSLIGDAVGAVKGAVASGGGL